MTLKELKAAFKEARTLYREDKTNKKNKKAWKAAKQAVADAEESKKRKGEEISEPSPKKIKKKKKEVEDADETMVAAETDNVLSGLKKGGGDAPKKKYNDDETPPSTRIFLGNLSYDIDDAKIKEFFADCGTLKDVFWMTDRETGDFRGMGIVEFETQELADKALLKNGQSLLGREIRANYTKPRPARGGGAGGKSRQSREVGEKPEGCNTVFLGNVPETVEDKNIYELFKDCGEIERIHWLTDRETGEFKRAGFVQFADPDKALPVAIKFNQAAFLGNTLRVDYSKPRAPKKY